jgi:GT2 family glycosyltransferase
MEDRPHDTRALAQVPSVTAVVVNWNGRDITLDCLRSLSGVSYPDLHILVVDNGSTDGSQEAIRREWPDVELLALPENIRFAGGNNAGILRALEQKSDMVMLLNNDTTIDGEAVRFLVGRMAMEPRCGAVSPKILYYDHKDTIWFAGGDVSMWRGTMSHKGIREKDLGQHNQAIAMDYATGCCVLVQSEVIRQVGLLDESYFMYGEDADWSQRIRSAGYSIWFEPRAMVWHRLSVSAGGHLSWFKLRHKYCSNLRYFVRYARWYHWFVFPWLHVLSMGWSAILFFLKRRR